MLIELCLGYPQWLSRTIGHPVIWIGSLIGGIPGGFVAALLAIPTAGALQVLVKEVWQATAPDQPEESPAPAAEPAEAYGNLARHRPPSDHPGQ